MQKSLILLLCFALVLLSSTAGFCAVSHVAITLDKVNYAPAETVYASIIIQDESSNPLANQLVIVGWTGPSEGLIREDHELTDVAGTVQVTLHLNATSGLGMYSVQAGSGNSTATAYFQVKAFRTFAVTVIMANLNAPIWVNGIQRSQGNTTLILAGGTYTLEVPSEYQGYSFKTWQSTSLNQTNPQLTIVLDKPITLTAVYKQGLTTQTMNWVMPYLLPIMLVVVGVICLVWIYREGYFDSLF